MSDRPGDPKYDEINRHIGGIAPGETRSVRPWNRRAMRLTSTPRAEAEQQVPLKRLGASGAASALLVIACVGVAFVRDGGTTAMDEVPWLLVLLVALMASLAEAGMVLVRTRSNAAIVVFLISAIEGFPLALMRLGD
jgi:hypothetical protein